MRTVVDKGSVLHLLDGEGNLQAEFAKPGASLQPRGGVFSYRPLLVTLQEARAIFNEHLTRTPAGGAVTVGAR
jgi:hypothetical protein